MPQMLLTLLLPVFVSAAEPSASTTTARGPRPAPAIQNPWSVSYGLNRRGNRYGQVDYRLRWSFSDLTGRSSEPPANRRPLESTFRGLLQGMKVDVYGVAIRPFRDLSLEAPMAVADFGASTETARGNPAPSAGRRRPIYSWERFYEDLENSARREGERFLVREGFNRALPEHRAVPYDQKKALGRGLLDLGRGAVNGETSFSP